MYKSLILLCVVFCVVIDARPKWQFLPARPGYVPVYIRAGDTPLEEINPELAEAFHALPAGRSAGKEVEASPDTPDGSDQSEEPLETPQTGDKEIPDKVESESKNDLPATSGESTVDRRPYEKKYLEKKTKKATEIVKPVET